MWTALQDKNIGLFADDRALIEELVSILVQDSMKRFSDSARIAFYDFDGSWKETMLPIDNRNKNFTYHPFKEDLHFFLERVEEHKKLICENTVGVEAPNKVLQFLCVPISSVIVKSLAEDQKTLELLRTFLTESYHERVYPVLLIENLTAFPRFLLQDFSQVFYMGENNMKLVSDVYFKDWAITKSSITQELIGFGAIGHGKSKELISLHHRSYELSEWGKVFFDALEEEEQMYREFLDSLNDGEE
jgi:hypothetical protein